jgi:hypothetical protein
MATQAGAPPQIPPEPKQSPQVNPPSASTPAAKPAPPKTLQQLLEPYISVKSLTDSSSHFTHEGICKKCGWHTMQLSDKAARDLLRQHVQQHWRSVTAQVTR